MCKIFFIIGAPRSGTTAISEILNTATNAIVYTEQSPKLCIAARMHYEGILPYPKEFIYKSKNPHIEETLRQGKIYGDKNPNYLYFIEEIVSIWKCKFVFVFRDGRDVVRSCMDFHIGRKPGYARYEDTTDSFITQPEEDFWDFSRIRPKVKSKMRKEWRNMDLFEKFSWGWAEFNRILLKKIKALKKTDCIKININTLTPKKLKEIFEFLGLKGYREEMISEKLCSKINTVKIEKNLKFPSWKYWDKELMEKFNKYAGNMMRKLGYY